MTTYEVNEAGVSKARALIKSHHYDLGTPWSEAAPSTEEANEMIGRHGYDGYGAWHLAIDAGASEQTKDRYGFPFGDFKRLNRAALVHAKQRAAQNRHHQIEAVADELLALLDDAAS